MLCGIDYTRVRVTVITAFFTQPFIQITGLLSYSEGLGPDIQILSSSIADEMWHQIINKL
jgi:hypothetical protein